MDKRYNARQVFDLSRKAHFFVDSVISAESTYIPRKCNFLLWSKNENNCKEKLFYSKSIDKKDIPIVNEE